MDKMFLLKISLITIFSVCTNFKFLGIKEISKKKIILITVMLIFLNVACCFVEIYFNSVATVLFADIMIAVICSMIIGIRLGAAILVTTLSLTVSYVLYSIAVIICFVIHKLIDINYFVRTILIIGLYLLMIKLFYNIKRLSKGIGFLKKYKENEYIDILILNISSIVFLSFVTLMNFEENLKRALLMFIIIFSGIMFITIQKSLQFYYKQKMLVKDLEETKAELEEKKKEVEELEKENLEFSKVSHSIAHKQRALEFKLNELSMKTEIADEIGIKDRIKNLNKDLRKEPVIVLDKTEIPEIDDMLAFMQSECIENKIDFQLQLSGNLYTMINHYIDKEDLEILLADHIKNAIIAIGYGDNDNKSILVRLGKLDGNYGLYIYDSGIEFEIETLLNLGKKPSTTHKDSGGTGMGFMNTFDTLRKYEASFIIEEYGEPVTDNFTKALKFKFDKKEEFRICSYRDKEIKNKDTQNILEVEKLIF